MIISAAPGRRVRKANFNKDKHLSR